MSREAFEAMHCGGCAQFIRRNEHGDYVLPSVQDAWSGWQSGQADAFERAAKVCETAGVLIDIDVWMGTKKALTAATATGLADAIRALAKEAT